MPFGSASIANCLGEHPLNAERRLDSLLPDDRRARGPIDSPVALSCTSPWQRRARAYAGGVSSKGYFPLWLGQLASSFGDTLHYIALVVLVFQITGQGIAVAGLVAAEILPVLMLGPIAGVVIDRFSRKSVLIGADLFRAGLAMSLVWPQGAWHAYLVAAGMAAGNTFFNPTVQAVIPVLTTEDQRLAANSVGWSTARLVNTPIVDRP